MKCYKSVYTGALMAGLLVVITLLAAPISGCASAPAGDSGNRAPLVEKLAVFKEESAWKGPASCAIHGKAVYVVYTADNNMGRVFKYDLTSGESTSSGDQFPTIGKDDRSHNDAAIAVDGEGYVHVFIGMHNHRMKYFRSLSPRSVEAFEDRSKEIPGYFDSGVNEKRYTYPRMCTSTNGDVFLILRRTGMFWDSNRRAIRESQHSEKQDLYHYDLSDKSWEVTLVKSKPGYNAYMSNIVPDGDNNVHMVTAWSWYHDGGNTFQRGSYLKFDGESHLYTLANGDEVLLPLNVDAPEANLFYEGDHPWGKETVEIQTPRVALDAKGNPVVAYTHTPDNGKAWNCRLAVWDGEDWQHTGTILQGFYQYERPEVTTTGGRYNIYVNGKVVSSASKDFDQAVTVSWENGTTVESVQVLDERTDIVMDRQAIYMVSY
jgi:hypothetical protein